MSAPSRTAEEEPRIVLPCGVTGFREHRRSEPLPETDRRAFAEMCNEVARATRSRAGAIKWAGITPNFHSALITYCEEKVTLLVHRHAPFLATAALARRAAPIMFIDDPRIHAALSLSSLDPFRLLTLRELRAPPDLTDLTALDHAELEQISYWRPSTVGELIFNYWD